MVSSRPRTYSVEAVVARASDFGEADKLVTLLTPFKGVVRAVAKGARKPKSKLGGNTDLLLHIKASLHEGRTLDGLSQVESIHSFRSARASLEKMSTALYMVELAERFSVEGGPNPPLFHHLVQSLEVLDSEPLSPLLSRWFEVRLLQLNGFLPVIGQCVDCGTALEPEDHVFSPARGGLVCPDCRASESDVLLPASVPAIKLLRRLAKVEWPVVAPLRAGDDELRQVGRILKEHMHFVLDRNVRSSAFMEEVTRWRSGDSAKE
jgi:DNA repair protein RecO (recombination protein O)